MNELITTLTYRFVNRSDEFGWYVTLYEDVTEIKYWEKRGGGENVESRFTLSAPYDLEIFKKIVEIRTNESKS